ncbi:MAG: M20/M25/M40 family metallo-hydrolase [Anaerolineae bacterium]|nr:M20/M25/M40 family metallo-hydrolase [Anaerolineae bacterium]
MPDRMAQDLIALCRIPSPSGQEGAVAAHIRRQVEALGLTVHEDDAGAALGSDTGNLIVQTGGVGEPLFLAAHMDTVPPTPIDGEVPVIVEGDRVHTGGRSILGGDDKAGVAVALAMLRAAVAEPGCFRPLDVVFTVQEEQGARGAGYLDPARLRARQGFNLDGDTPVAVAIRHAPHKCRFYIDVTGRAAHAALNPEDGINAIAAVGAVAAALPTGRLDARSIANLGLVTGGGPINVVPGEARLVGELRSLDREALDARQTEIEATAIRAGAAKGAQVSVRWEELYGGYTVPDEAGIVRLFRAACEAAGHTPALVSTYGGGDANPFNNKGLACIVFGLGMEAIHSPHEFILLSSLAEAARILRGALAAGDLLLNEA